MKRGEKVEAQWAAEPDPSGWLNSEWLASLKQLSRLRKIDLSGHGKYPNAWLTDAGLTALGPMPQLRELVLVYCSGVSPEAIANLHAEHPHCGVRQ